MNQIAQEIIKKINEKTRNKPIVYFSNDIERSFGLEKYLDHFYMFCIDKNEIVDYAQKDFPDRVFCLGKISDEEVFRSSVKLVSHSETQKRLKDLGSFYAQTFKISPRFEFLAKNLGATLLNTQAKLNRLFESKLSQFEALSKSNVNFPKTIITKVNEIDFEYLKKELELPFVLQYNRGHTGDGTLIIQSKEDLKQLEIDFPERTVKISKYIDSSLMYNCNVCITNKNNYIAGINYQITGVKELTNKDRATVGNDFSNFAGINENVISKLKDEIQKISDNMRKNGYLGLYGVDFIIKDEEVFIIEINARQTQSIPFLTKLQFMQNEVPLLLMHVAQFLGIEFELDQEEYNQRNTKPINASQIFLRSQTDGREVKGNVKPGIYRLQSDNAAREAQKNGNKNIIFTDEESDMPLIFQREGYNIDSLDEIAGFLILAKSLGQKVKDGDELARIQMLQPALNKNFVLEKWIIEAMKSIDNYLK